MAGAFPLPAADAVGKLFEGLIGRKVTSKDGKLFAPGPSAHAYVGVFRTDQGAFKTAVLMDIQLAANLAAALVMVPAGVVNDSVRAGALAPNLLENLREVMNVCNRFFNLPGQPHVSLKEIVACPPALPAELAAVVAKPGTAMHAEVAVTGYGGGRISLLG